ANILNPGTPFEPTSQERKSSGTFSRKPQRFPWRPQNPFARPSPLVAQTTLQHYEKFVSRELHRLPISRGRPVHCWTRSVFHPTFRKMYRPPVQLSSSH